LIPYLGARQPRNHERASNQATRQAEAANRNNEGLKSQTTSR
jgi:hypothetical protein